MYRDNYLTLKTENSELISNPYSNKVYYKQN